MKNKKFNYEDLIVSTPEYCTFLHRCSSESARKIMDEGLVCGENLQSTSTLQPRNLSEAKRLYFRGRGYGDSVAVIRVPNSLWGKNVRGNEGTEENLAYWNKNAKDFTLKPEFIVASIDRKTNEVKKRKK